MTQRSPIVPVVRPVALTPLARALMGGGVAVQTIGGVAIGASGSGIYSGYILSDGDEFQALDLVSSANPSGAYFVTRAYRGDGSPGPGLRAPGSGPLAVMHDVSPDYTGWQDSNRGVALNFDSHSIVTGEGSGALRLHSIRQTTQEQAKLATGVSGQIERGSMIHSAGRMWINTPGVTEFRARFPAGPLGQHPTMWLLSVQPPGGPTFTGNEYGFEGSGAGLEAYHIDWNAGVTAGTALSTGATYRDGNWHTFTVKADATQFVYYVDGVLVHTIARDPDGEGDKAVYFLLTNHVYNGAFMGETYDAASWAAATNGADIDIEWVRFWRASTGAHYVPLASIPDTFASAGGAVNIVLPAQTALWGATGLTEYVTAIPAEVEEPGGSNSGAYGQLPAGLSYNQATRTISGTMPASQAGVLHLVVGVSQDGCTCKPARFRINVAPRFQGVTTQSFINGSPVSLDVYPMWDVGRMFQAGSNPKGLTVTGLPSGLSFSPSTGLITGTPTVSTTGSMTMTSSNSAGQMTSQSVSWTVSAAASGVAAPTITGAPTLVASWDPADNSKITQAAGNVSAIAGSDGTSYTLSQPGSAYPTLATRSSRQVLRFTSASSQFLTLASAMGLQGSACTMVVVFEPATTSATQAVLDIANGATGLTGNRHSLIASTSSGYSHRKCDSVPNQSIASTGSAYTAGLRLLVGVSPAGASQAAKLYFDGAGTPITAGVTGSGPSSLDTVTLGASTESGSKLRFADGYVYRVLVYAAELSAAQAEEIAVWAATNYGTTNAT